MSVHRTESEVQEIHDCFQEIQQRGPGAHAIADIIRREQEAQGGDSDIDASREDGNHAGEKPCQAPAPTS
jgi:hypothetical protein